MYPPERKKALEKHRERFNPARVKLLPLSSAPDHAIRPDRDQNTGFQAADHIVPVIGEGAMGKHHRMRRRGHRRRCLRLGHLHCL